MKTIPNLSDKQIARFWSRVDKGDGCWLWNTWTAAGYGLFKVNGQYYGAHRVSYFLEHGPLPDKMFVCHHCDTTECVRPDHLFLGTAADNTQDMVRKKRGQLYEKGYVPFNRKLTPEQIAEIRSEYAAGRATQTALGKRYGVSQTNIGLIVNGKIWREPSTPDAPPANPPQPTQGTSESRQASRVPVAA